MPPAPKTTPRQEDIKREHYRQEAVTTDYERVRFGSPGGRWVKSREESIVAELAAGAGLPAGAVALDLPTGTGRMIPVLRPIVSRIIAADASESMLALARAHAADDYLLADAGALPLPAASADLVVCSRFFFHVADPGRYLAEAARVLRPGGAIIFDVYNWTPKAWLPGAQQRLGGRMYEHKPAVIARLAQAHGFTVAATTGVFVLPPLVYRHLPLFVVHFAEWLGRVTGLPRAKHYYLLRRSAPRA